MQTDLEGNVGHRIRYMQALAKAVVNKDITPYQADKLRREYDEK